MRLQPMVYVAAGVALLLAAWRLGGAPQESTVRARLLARGVLLQASDHVTPALGQRVKTDAPVFVRRTSCTRVPPPVVFQNTPWLTRGEQRTIVPGRSGTLQVVSLMTVRAHGPIRVQTVRRSMVRPPIPARRWRGTSVGHSLVRDGVHYTYIKAMRLVSTAYNGSYAQNGPWGAVAAYGGRPLTRGMAAVDPRIIPLGSRLYVDGYGPALAADTGSAIVGDRIDLYMDRASVSFWGFRPVNVYILGQ